MADNSISFLDVCKDVTKTATKIPTTDYLPIGKYKIFDQGKDYIGGFRDSAIGLASDVPYILFGDHTRIIKYIDEPCFIGADGVKLLKVKDSRYTSKYIYYAMKAQPIESQGYARHFKFLKEQFYRYTTIEKQQRIVAELDNIEEGIRVKEEQLKALDELIQSRFTEIFGNIHTNKFGWSIKKIEEIATCIAGATPSTLKEEYWEGGTIPWLSSGEVHKGRIFDTDKKITESGYNNCSTKLIPAHTVVLALAGQGKTRGTVAVAEIRLCTNQSICSLVTNKSINTDYLYYYLKSQYEALRDASNGAGGRGGLNLKIVGQFKILLPPLPLQNQFAEFVQKVESAKEIVKIQIKDLQELLALKMDEYFK